jgi:hypothetical protein
MKDKYSDIPEYTDVLNQENEYCNHDAVNDSFGRITGKLNFIDLVTNYYRT